MKKIFVTLMVFAVMLMTTVCFAAGTYTVTTQSFSEGGIVAKIVYKSDSSDGSVPDVILGKEVWKANLGRVYLYAVRAYPVTGGVSPDAADVLVLNPRSTDLLGGEGTNLISPTVEQEVEPYNTFTEKNKYPLIVTPLTVRVANQATPLSDFVVEVEATR